LSVDVAFSPPLFDPMAAYLTTRPGTISTEDPRVLRRIAAVAGFAFLTMVFTGCGGGIAEGIPSDAPAVPPVPPGMDTMKDKVPKEPVAPAPAKKSGRRR
jgi:hypothetical protein